MVVQIPGHERIDVKNRSFCDAEQDATSTDATLMLHCIVLNHVIADPRCQAQGRCIPVIYTISCPV